MLSQDNDDIIDIAQLRPDDQVVDRVHEDLPNASAFAEGLRNNRPQVS